MIQKEDIMTEQIIKPNKELVPYEVCLAEIPPLRNEN